MARNGLGHQELAHTGLAEEALPAGLKALARIDRTVFPPPENPTPLSRRQGGRPVPDALAEIAALRDRRGRALQPIPRPRHGAADHAPQPGPRRRAWRWHGQHHRRPAGDGCSGRTISMVVERDPHLATVLEKRFPVHSPGAWRCDGAADVCWPISASPGWRPSFPACRCCPCHARCNARSSRRASACSAGKG